MFETAPHGAICAALLPFVFRKNVEVHNPEILNKNSASKHKQMFNARQVLEKQLSMNPEDARIAARLERFNEVARVVTGVPDATAQQGALFLETLVSLGNVESYIYYECRRKKFTQCNSPTGERS